MTNKFDSMSKSDQAYSLYKASTLVEALPYIRQHSGKIIVIKYGGHAMGNQKLSESFSKDIGLIKEVGIKPIIIHGGGPQIKKSLQEKTCFGKLVFISKINIEIVKNINDSGGRAIGLAGNKDKLIQAKKIEIKNTKKKIDMGFVGNPIKINVDLINNYINQNYIPVIAPLGTDGENTYNINADTAAGAIAGAIKAKKLLLLTDVSGIVDEKNKLIHEINLEEAKKIINENFISGGMKPKIETCIKALDKGVNEATIMDGHISHSVILELFTIIGIGTQIKS